MTGKRKAKTDTRKDKIKYFLDHMQDINPDALYPTDMKDAIIGYVERAGMSPQILLDREKCIDCLVKGGIKVRDDAEEFFEYNTIGSFMGKEVTPCFATLIQDIK